MARGNVNDIISLYTLRITPDFRYEFIVFDGKSKGIVPEANKCSDAHILYTICSHDKYVCVYGHGPTRWGQQRMG